MKYLSMQKLLKRSGAARIEYKGQWMKWSKSEKCWIVKRWQTNLDGSRRIKILVRTTVEAEAIGELMRGETEEEKEP